MNSYDNGNGQHQLSSQSSGGTHGLGAQGNHNGPKASGQQPMGIPTSGYQYINKQVNNVKLVNNNNLTLNVRNFNNRISSININNIQENDQAAQQNMKVKTQNTGGKGSTQPIPSGTAQSVLKTQRYSRENSLNKNYMEGSGHSNENAPGSSSAKSANKSSNQ